MKNITVKVLRCDEDNNIELPVYQTVGSAGCDIRSRDSDFIGPGERHLFRTGLKFEIPEGYECQIRPRSSLARQNGIIVFNSPSTIDSDFRGELAILLFNTSRQAFRIVQGDRIAQLVFAPVTKATFELVTELGKTERGEGGWGSTGKN